MRRIVLFSFICFLLVAPSVQAQTPVPTPFPILPVAAPTSFLPPEVGVALVALAVISLGGFGAWIAGWFTRQTNKANAQVAIDAKAAEIKADLDAKTKEITADLESQTLRERQANLKERETIRVMVDFYVKRVNELTTEIDLLRTAFRSEGDGFRSEILTVRAEATECKNEIRQNKDEISGLKAEIVELKTEIVAGHKREAKLREDVDHMPKEINRLKALVEKQGNGDGQGNSKTVLDTDEQERVAGAEDDVEKDPPESDKPT